MASFYVPQFEDEAFWRYFIRLQDPLLVPCDCELWEICEAIYEGLNYSTRLVVEDMFNGAFRSLSYGEAWDYYHWLSQDTHEWDRAMGFQNLGCSTTFNPNSITLNPGWEGHMNITDENEQNDNPPHHPQHNHPPHYNGLTQLPYQGPSPSQALHSRSSTEEMLNLLTKNVLEMQHNMVQFQEETCFNIKNLERQLGQVSGLVTRVESIWESGELPIQMGSQSKPKMAYFEDEDTILETKEMNPSCEDGDVVEKNTVDDEVLDESIEALMSVETREVSCGETSSILLPHVCFSKKHDLIPSFPLFLPHFIHAPLLEEFSTYLYPPHSLVQATEEVKACDCDIFPSFPSFHFNFPFSTYHFLVSSFVSFHSFSNLPQSYCTIAFTLVSALLFLFTNLVNSEFWAVAHDKLLRSLRCYLLNNT